MDPQNHAASTQWAQFSVVNPEGVPTAGLRFPPVEFLFLSLSLEAGGPGLLAGAAGQKKKRSVFPPWH